MISTALKRAPLALLASLVIAACSDDAAATKRTPTPETATAKLDDSSNGVVDLGAVGYKSGALTTVGSVSGTIKLDGTPPSDSMTVDKDQPVCRPNIEGAVTANATGVSNVVVWIADAKTGKDLPADLRAELASEDCAISPRVQAMVVGTTVNVYNDDRLLHRLVFTRSPRDTVTTMPFFNAGQVVPSERLTKTPGIVEVRCVQHAWTHGYIAVFDHPYFAVTQRDGSCKIDSLPAGTHKMMVWHEGMAKPLAQQIQVAANGTAKVDLSISLAPLP